MLNNYFRFRIPKATDTYRTAFFLAENDAILDAGRVARYLRDHGAKYVEDGGNLHFLKGLAHGKRTDLHMTR